MRVRLADIFDKESGKPVPDEQNRRHGAGPAKPAASPAEKHHHAERQPLEPGLVELAWMARQTIASRKDHAPGQVGHPAIKLGIDEIRQPPQKQADGKHHGHTIADRQHRNAPPPCEQPHRDRDAQQATME